MKKLVSTALVALITVSVFAQDQKQERRHHRQDFTVDQIAELQTKKMTLQLDLNNKQQDQIFEINKENAIERKQKIEARKAIKESKKELSSDEIFKRKSERLDKQIAHKAEMKKILSDEQYDKWEKTRKRRGHHLKKKAAKRRMHHKKKGKKRELKKKE